MPTSTVGPPFDLGVLPPLEHFVGRGEDVAWVIERLTRPANGDGQLASIAAANGLAGIGKAAASSFEEAVQIVREIGDNVNYATGALQLGTLLIEYLDQRERGCALLAEAVRIHEELGLHGAEEAREIARQLGCD